MICEPNLNEPQILSAFMLLLHPFVTYNVKCIRRRTVRDSGQILAHQEDIYTYVS